MAGGGGLGASRGKAVRLLTLVAALLEQSRTREALRDVTGLYPQPVDSTARQQFERDKAELAEAGLEIIAMPGHHYRIAQHGSATFTEPELEALHELAGVVADPAHGAALAVLASGAEAYPELRAGARVLSTVPDALVDISQELLHAIEKRVVVRFRYRGVNNPVSDREVEPWALRSRRGLWYVVAHCRDAGRHRHFRLDRIEGGVVRSDEPATVERPHPIPSDLLPGGVGEVVVRLVDRGRFDAHRLGATLDPSDPEDLDRPGELPAPTMATFPALRDEAAVAFALRFDGQIVSPAALDEERRQRADRVHDTHSLAPAEPPVGLGEVTREPRPQLDAARLRRLLLLPSWLRARPGITVKEAARGLGCSAAELRAELDVLGSVVLPDVGEVFDLGVTGPEEDAEIDGRCDLYPTLQLTALERSQVRTLLTTGRELLADPKVHEGLDRLDDRLDDASAAVVDQDVSPKLLHALSVAVNEHRVIAFRYRRRDDDAAMARTITPTELVHAHGQTYAVGFDHDRELPRSFRLDRLTDLEVGKVDVEPRDVELPTPSYVPVGDETEVVLRATHVGSWVLTRLVPRHRMDLEGGMVWAVVRTDAPARVLDHVLVAGGEVEVISPPELRAAVAERAATVR